MNTKLFLVVIVIAVIVIAGVAFSLGSNPAAPQTGVTVYIDSTAQTADYTQTNAYDWGQITSGYTYTRNFTVANTGTQTYTITLLTTEPPGTASTWEYNNTQLPPNTYKSAALTYQYTPTTAGSYTWQLLASNNTITATPTPDPSATPTPNSISFTINADSNVESIAISVNNRAPYTIDSFPTSYTCTPGDDIKFTPTFATDYVLNGWEFTDGSIPVTTALLSLSNISGNFTVTCTSQYMTPSPTT